MNNETASTIEAKARTLAFYDTHAHQYFRNSVNLDMMPAYERFLAHVHRGARLLDAGSGSGRDTRAFLERGYQVDAFDASPALAELSTKFTGIQTKVMDFLNLDVVEQYDGIWACASLLHVPRSQMTAALQRLGTALKIGGVLYASFRHGGTEKVAADGRFFTDMQHGDAVSIVASVPALRLIETWTNVSPGAQGGELHWFNILCKRNPC